MYLELPAVSVSFRGGLVHRYFYRFFISTLSSFISCTQTQHEIRSLQVHAPLVFLAIIGGPDFAFFLVRVSLRDPAYNKLRSSGYRTNTVVQGYISITPSRSHHYSIEARE